MKIIKSGYDKTYIIQCKNCYSDLEYCLSDLEKEQRGTPTITYKIKCPVCGEKIMMYELKENKTRNLEDEYKKYIDRINELKQYP